MTAEKVGRPSVSTIEHPFLFVIEGASLDVPDSKGGDPLSDKMSDFNITVAGTVAYALHIESGYFTHKDGSRFDVVVRVTDVFHNSRLCLFIWRRVALRYEELI